MNAAPNSRRPRSAGLPPYFALELSDAVFQSFQGLIHREAGISLGPQKKALVQGRLSKRLRQLGIERFRDYLEAVQSDPAERQRMIELICTHETSFFREARQFERLERVEFPSWRAAAALGGRRSSVRVWSAGCSTGEEPYSIAMSLLDAFGAGGWRLEVEATDLSQRVLDSAARAIYPMSRLSEIPAHLHKRFLRRGVGENAGTFAISSVARALVSFRPLNLRGADWPIREHFDLVFCRNVLIYFDREDRDRIARRLLASVEPGGLLLVGHAESLQALTGEAERVAPTIYRRRLTARASAA